MTTPKTVPTTSTPTAPSPRSSVPTLDLFNWAIWASIKGANSTMPAPQHSLWGAVPNKEADG
jgi:hypothetical protein